MEQNNNKYSTPEELADQADKLADELIDAYNSIIMRHSDSDKVANKRITMQDGVNLALYPIAKLLALNMVALAAKQPSDQRAAFIMHTSSCQQQLIDKITNDFFARAKEHNWEI